MKIEKSHYNGNEFGSEGVLLKYPADNPKIVSFENVVAIVSNTLSPILKQRSLFWPNKPYSIVKKTLGEKEEYNIPEILESLRSIPSGEKSREQMLIQRGFRIWSTNFLNPISMSEIDLNQLLTDLNLLEGSLCPEGKTAGAVAMYSFRLYQDKFRRVRIHIYPDLQDQFSADEFPHEHYGHSASVVLAGAIVNQHLIFRSCNFGESPLFGLYELKREGFSSNPEATKILNKKGEITCDVISSHCYRSGDHFIMPSSSPHQVASLGGTMTLFFQELKDFSVSLTTRNIEDPENIEIPYHSRKKFLSPEEASKMLTSYSTRVLIQSFQSSRVRTILDRYGNFSQYS